MELFCAYRICSVHAVPKMMISVSGHRWCTLDMLEIHLLLMPIAATYHNSDNQKLAMFSSQLINMFISLVEEYREMYLRQKNATKL